MRLRLWVEVVVRLFVFEAPGSSLKTNRQLPANVNNCNSIYLGFLVVVPGLTCVFARRRDLRKQKSRCLKFSLTLAVSG